MGVIYLKNVERRVHYRPYEEDPAACGLVWPNYETDDPSEVTCPDCKDELS